MNDSVKPLVHELKQGLVERYGERLQGVYLYGSYARGEADSDSDVDVLIVLDHLERYGAEIERTSHLVAALSLKYEVSVSRVFVSQQDWTDRQTPFLANAREEAVASLCFSLPPCPAKLEATPIIPSRQRSRAVKRNVVATLVQRLGP